MSSVRTQRAIAEENAKLSVDLARRLEESRALTASLDRQREETRRLADMVIHAQEEERRRVARELHDEANQLLAALMTTVDAAEAAAAREGQAELTATLARLRKLASATLPTCSGSPPSCARPPSTSSGCSPRSPGTSATAPPAPRSRPASTPRAGPAGCPDRRGGPLPDRPGGARQRPEARRRPQGAAAAALPPERGALDVSDDGVGFDLDEEDGAGRSRLGIAGMRERASIVGGTVT